MKTVNVSEQAAEINALLEEARNEDLLVRTVDGMPSTVRTSKSSFRASSSNALISAACSDTLTVFITRTVRLE